MRSQGSYTSTTASETLQLFQLSPLKVAPDTFLLDPLGRQEGEEADSWTADVNRCRLAYGGAMCAADCCGMTKMYHTPGRNVEVQRKQPSAQ